MYMHLTPNTLHILKHDTTVEEMKVLKDNVTVQRKLEPFGFSALNGNGRGNFHSYCPWQSRFGCIPSSTLMPFRLSFRFRKRSKNGRAQTRCQVRLSFNFQHGNQSVRCRNGVSSTSCLRVESQHRILHRNSSTSCLRVESQHRILHRKPAGSSCACVLTRPPQQLQRPQMPTGSASRFRAH